MLIVICRLCLVVWNLLTKGFARMQQGTGGLVQSYAILASTLFAVGAAFRAMENAANIQNQIKGFKN